MLKRIYLYMDEFFLIYMRFALYCPLEWERGFMRTYGGALY